MVGMEKVGVVRRSVRAAVRGLAVTHAQAGQRFRPQRIFVVHFVKEVHESQRPACTEGCRRREVCFH